MGTAARPRVRSGHGVKSLSSCLKLLYDMLVSGNTHILLFSSVHLMLVFFGLPVRVTFEFDCIVAGSGAGQQHSNIFAKFGAEAKVDERVVEACGLGEEPGEDASQAGYLVAAG